MTFTKEQLQLIIETDHVQCGDAAALARELLESRADAEPVGYYRLAEDGVSYYLSSPNEHRDGCIPLYTRPQPAPVVPDGVTRKDFEAWARSAGFNEDWYFFTNTHPNYYDDDNINDMWVAWNACRAAMLQATK